MVTLKTKEIDILPDRSLMPKIGQTGYSVSQAVAELVDNSIDARKENEVLTVEVHFDPQAKSVEVSDDGVGMNEEAAANSIKLAHSSKKNKLGEFGLGMKTASTSLGKTFRVSTTQKGSDEEYILEYDEAKWLKSGDWRKHEMKIKSGVDKNRSGTAVHISNLSFNIYGNLPGGVRKDLAERFAPFIENGEVRIKVNTKWCAPLPMELKTEYHEPDGKDHFRFKLESGNEIWGWRGLLKKGSEKGEYGFRVFRRGRVILQHTKIGFNPHPEARQIVGELHLDHIPVTHNKREFIQESPFWHEIKKEGGIFWEFMREIVKESRSSERKTHIDQGVLDKIDLQKENIMKAVKQLPQLREYAFPDVMKKMKASAARNDGVDIAEMEKRDKREVITIEEEPIPTDEQGRKPKKTQTRRTYFIWVNGKKFKFDHSFVDLKTEDVMKDKVIDEKTGIHVYTNTAFPGFANTKDHVFYGAWHIAEAIAEIMVEENKKPASEILVLRDLMLKKCAEITRELDQVEQERRAADKLKKEYEEKIEKIKELEGKARA